MIVVNLNARRSMDSLRCPTTAQNALAVHISFNAAIMQHAMDNWPTSHEKLSREGKFGPYYYQDDVYTRLGL